MNGRTGDRQVRRTERLLHEALGALIHEKPYDAIGIKEILARADVARSTFYTHFRDKDELLLAGIRGILRSAAAAPGAATRHERVLRLALPLFEHIAQHRERFGGAITGDAQRALHERLQQVIEQFAAQELGGDRRGTQAPSLPPELLARHVASSFTHVLGWWMDTAPHVGPREADRMFRALAGPPLAPS